MVDSAGEEDQNERENQGREISLMQSKRNMKGYEYVNLRRNTSIQLKVGGNFT